jgi:AraC-like DNA-binding protein
MTDIRKETDSLGVVEVPADKLWGEMITAPIAMAEIAAGRLPPAQIALNARFSSPASFTRAFRRATGMTLAEYRRRRRNTPAHILLAAPAQGVQIDRNSAEI